MAWGDALDAEILGGIARKLEHLGGEVLKDGGGVDGGCGADAALIRHTHLEVAVDTTNRELKARLRRTRHRLLRLQLGSITLNLGGHCRLLPEERCTLPPPM